MSDRTVVTIGRFKYPFAITLMTIAVLTVVGLFIYVYVFAESSSVEEEDPETEPPGPPPPWYEGLTVRGDGLDDIADYSAQGGTFNAMSQQPDGSSCGAFIIDVVNAHHEYDIVHLQHVSDSPILSSYATYTCAGDLSQPGKTNVSTLAEQLNDFSTYVCVESPVTVGEGTTGPENRTFDAGTTTDQLCIGNDRTGVTTLYVDTEPVPGTGMLCYKLKPGQDPGTWTKGQPVRNAELGCTPESLGCTESDYCPKQPRPQHEELCWWNRCKDTIGIKTETAVYDGPRSRPATRSGGASTGTGGQVSARIWTRGRRMG